MLPLNFQRAVNNVLNSESTLCDKDHEKAHLRSEEMDKCTGPPVYDGLTQAAILMQLHIHLSVLEEETKRAGITIKNLQRAVNFLLSGKATPPGSGIRKLDDIAHSAPQSAEPKKVVSRKIPNESGQGLTSGGSAEPKLWPPWIRMKGIPGKKTPGKEEVPNTSGAEESSNTERTSLLTRAKTSGLQLSRGKDPIPVPQRVQKSSTTQPPHSVAVQVKKMPDGSIAGRARASHKKGHKPGYPTGQRRTTKTVFHPPPENITVTPSSTSVQAPRL